MNASTRLSLAAAVLAISACGQTGDLVLPEQAAANKAAKAEKARHRNPLLVVPGSKPKATPAAEPAAAATPTASEPAPAPAP